MADCYWCDESLPGDDIPSCNECLFKATPKVGVKDNRKVPSDYDLSYYETDDGRPKSAGRSASQIRAALSQVAKARPQESLEKLEMNMMKVKSNSYRNRSLLVDDNLVLFFDDSGVAEVPSHERARVERLMMHRPGRFRIVEDDAMKAKKPTPDLEALRKRAEESRKEKAAEEAKKAEESQDEAEAASEESAEKASSTDSDNTDDKSSKPKRRTKKKSSSSK